MLHFLLLPHVYRNVDLLAGCHQLFQGFTVVLMIAQRTHLVAEVDDRRDFRRLEQDAAICLLQDLIHRVVENHRNREKLLQVESSGTGPLQRQI